MIEVSPADLLLFLDRIEALRKMPASVPKWLRARVLQHGEARCWHCEKSPATRAVYLFSPALGGDASGANVIPSCDRCAVRHRDRDPWELVWAEGRDWSGDKAARRLSALATCAQAPVPKAHARSREQTRMWLETTRWTAAPRVGVVAEPLGEGWLVGPVVAGASPAWVAVVSGLSGLGAQAVALAPALRWLPGEAWADVQPRWIERGAFIHETR